jgi:hypothetical protein
MGKNRDMRPHPNPSPKEKGKKKCRNVIKKGRALPNTCGGALCIPTSTEFMVRT